MRFGINITSLSDTRRTGIGRYTWAILREFLISAPENEYYLYSGRPITASERHELSGLDNVFLREGTCPSRYVWQLLFLGKWLSGDNIQAFLATDGVLPLGCKTPAVSVVHDLIWYRFPKSVSPHIYWTYRIRLKQSVKEAYCCVASSLATKRDLIDYANLEASKVHLVYLGVDSQFKSKEDKEIGPILARKGVKQPYMLFVGNLMKHKNVTGLVGAYRAIVEKAQGTHSVAPDLVLAGCKYGSGNHTLKTVGSLGLQGRVAFMDYVKDKELVALYCAAELFVLPSFLEGFGLPVLEAQACGTPVACSRTGSLPEVAGEGAVYFDPYDLDDMATKVWQLIADQKLRETMKEKGYENLRRFSWQRSAEKLLGLMHEAAQRPSQ